MPKNKIQITVKKLVIANESGALTRFFALDRPIQMAWKNRKQLAACNEELQFYSDKLKELCEKYGTVSVSNPNAYVFDVDNKSVAPGTEGPQKKLFEIARAELEAQVVSTIPGDPVKVSETVGTLKVSDCEILEGTFLVD
jgi:hypothetical protein